MLDNIRKKNLEMVESRAVRERTMSAPAGAIVGQAGPRQTIDAPRPAGKKMPRKFSFTDTYHLQIANRRRVEGSKRNQSKQMRWEVGTKFMK